MERTLKVLNQSLTHFAHFTSRWTPPISDLNTTEYVKAFAGGIFWALVDGIKAVGKCSSEVKAKSVP